MCFLQHQTFRKYFAHIASANYVDNSVNNKRNSGSIMKIKIAKRFGISKRKNTTTNLKYNQIFSAHIYVCYIISTHFQNIYQLKYFTCITVSPLSRIFGGSISVIAGYPKLPYPKLKIRICDVNDNVGTSKDEPETHQNNAVMSDIM